MKINEITIERKYNLGNYETMGFKISVIPSSEEENKQWDTVMEEITQKISIKLKELKEKYGSEL